MEKKQIMQAVEGAVAARGCFIVDVTVSGDNDIELIIEKDCGDVELEDCESVNDAFLEAFDKDAEDYSLTVSSAGLDRPFKVLRQYTKAIGSQVEVLLKGGRKLVGVLTAADDEGICLRHSQKEAVEGRKRKELVEREERLTAGEINSVAPHIVFKK